MPIKERPLVQCCRCEEWFDPDDIVSTENDENYCMGCYIDLEYPENV